MVYKLIRLKGMLATSNGVVVETGPGLAKFLHARIDTIMDWARTRGIRVECVSEFTTLPDDSK